MLIRKLGDAEFREYSDEECAWCDAGRDTQFSGAGDVIYFENDRQEKREVHCLSNQDELGEGSPLILICKPLHRHEIEGWTCWVMPSGIRAASPDGKQLVNLFTYSESGLAVSDVRRTLQAPDAVIMWLLSAEVPPTSASTAEPAASDRDAP